MSYSKSAYESNVLANKRLVRGLGFGVRRTPYSVDAIPALKRGVRPSPLSQWLVDGATLEASIVDKYPTMQPGVVKQMMAGTGVGKSTTVPCIIASKFGQVVICLLPEDPSPDRTVGYVEGKVAAKYGLQGSISVLRGADVGGKGKTRGAHVYYTTLGDMLAFMASTPDVMEVLGASCVIVDESHIKNPQYVFFRYLVAAGYFKTVKVFYMSATAADDVSMEQNSLRKTIEYEPNDLPDTPGATGVRSPAHYSHVVNRTLIFVGHDREFELWQRYYDSHDIPCMSYGYSNGVTAMSGVDKFLDENSVGVVLTTGVLQSSYTLNVDTVVCLGYSARITSDFSNGDVTVSRIPVSKPDQIQRAGRVGRFKAGNAHVAKVRYSQPISEDDPDVACYIYLWCRMFGLEVKHPTIAMFSELYADYDLSVIGDMLTSVIPPLMMVPYYHDTGVYCGWERAMASLNSTRIITSSSVGNEVKANDWPQRTFVHDSLGTEVKVFRSRANYGDDFTILAYHLWALYVDDDGHDAGSISATVYDPVSSGKKAALRRVTTTGKPKHYRHNSDRRYTTASVVDIDISTYDGTATKSKTDLPAVPVIPSEFRTTPNPLSRVSSAGTSDTSQTLPKYELSPSPITEEIEVDTERFSNVMSWDDRRSISSSSSKDLDVIKLRQCSAIKYCGEYLYPMDAALLKLFREAFAVTRVDDTRVNQLLAGTRTFSRSTRETNTLRVNQAEDFLSLLRVHRASIGAVLQLSAVRYEKRNFFGVTRLFTPSAETLQSKITRLAQLIDVCGLEDYKVGRRLSKRHCGSDSVTDPTAALELRSIEADFALRNSPLMVARNVKELATGHVPVTRDGVFDGNAWYVDDKLLSSWHLFENMRPDMVNRFMTVSDPSRRVSDDVVVYRMDPGGAKAVLRVPVPGEFVGILGGHTKHVDPRLYGYHRVLPYVQNYAIQGAYYPTMSGSLVVAYNDAAVVGTYTGRIGKVDGKIYSRFDTVPR